MDKEDLVEDKFNELVNDLTDDEWWDWIRNWLDVGMITDIYRNWDTELKKEAIEELKDIIKKRGK